MVNFKVCWCIIKVKFKLFSIISSLNFERRTYGRGSTLLVRVRVQEALLSLSWCIRTSWMPFTKLEYQMHSSLSRGLVPILLLGLLVSGITVVVSTDKFLVSLLITNDDNRSSLDKQLTTSEILKQCNWNGSSLSWCKTGCKT